MVIQGRGGWIPPPIPPPRRGDEEETLLERYRMTTNEHENTKTR